jgi:hypothetical protein
LFVNLATRASGKTPTEGSLKVTEFDQCDRGVCISFEVPRAGNDNFHELLLACGLVFGRRLFG